MIVSPNYFALVKSRLRMRSDALDAEIESHILAARAVMRRLGIKQEVVEDENNPDVLAAVRAFVLWQFTNDDTISERSRRDFRDMVDELRKHKGYIDDS